MTRRLPQVVLVVVVVLVGALAGLLWLAHDETSGSARPSDIVRIDASVSPDAHLFGEPVAATVDVVVDGSVVDVDSVRVEPDFTPYEAVGPARVERSSAGDVGVVRLTYTLRCLKEGCDASGARGLVELPTGRVVYRFLGGSGASFAALDWPAFEVAARVSDADVELIRWRAAEAALPAVDTRFDPTVLAAVLVAAAVLLSALAVWLARRLWLEPRAGLDADGVGVVTAAPLERALALVRDASRNGDLARRRRALERVAVELGAVGRVELAEEARALAWSPREATEAEVEALAVRAGEAAA